MSVSAAVEGLRGMSRLGPVGLVGLIVLALAVGGLMWPTTTDDMVRVRLAE